MAPLSLGYLRASWPLVSVGSGRPIAPVPPVLGHRRSGSWCAARGRVDAGSRRSVSLPCRRVHSGHRARNHPATLVLGPSPPGELPGKTRWPHRNRREHGRRSCRHRGPRGAPIGSVAVTIGAAHPTPLHRLPRTPDDCLRCCAEQGNPCVTRATGSHVPRCRACRFGDRRAEPDPRGPWRASRRIGRRRHRSDAPGATKRSETGISVLDQQERSRRHDWYGDHHIVRRVSHVSSHYRSSTDGRNLPNYPRWRFVGNRRSWSGPGARGRLGGRCPSE
jgi:hypothetical protein